MKGFMLVAVLLVGCMNQPDDSLPVYLLLGQSNMVGMRSEVAALPVELRAVQPLALFFKDGAWIPLSPGVSEAKGFGPEISLAHELARQGRPFGLIKVSYGATTLAKDWSPSNPGGMYGQAISQVKAAKQTRNIKVVGVLWMQGESDGETAEIASAYKENLELFVAALRRDTQSGDVPFVACRVTAPEVFFPYIGMVREAQESFTGENYHWLNCDSLTKVKDRVHFDTAGQVELGRLFYEAIQQP